MAEETADRQFAPIVLFVYNRPEHTLKTLTALKANTLARSSILYVFADGAKPSATPDGLVRIGKTREIVKSDQWCAEVVINESDSNLGLAKSIEQGVTKVVNRHGNVVVLEDDIVTGPYFLEYMNKALRRYKDISNVWHVSGWNYPVASRKANAAFFWRTMNCWGWATWADRWGHYKKNAELLLSEFSQDDIYRFNVDGTEDFWQQVVSNKQGAIDTWAIFWYATIFRNNGLCLSPYRSLVKNVGLDGSGVHCGESPADTIVGPIDHRINEYPTECAVNRFQYLRLKHYFRKRNLMDIAGKTMKLAKRGLRAAGLFEWAKRVYRRTLPKKET